MPGLLGMSLTADDLWDTIKSVGRGINLGSTSGLLGTPVDMATMLLNNPGMIHPGLLGAQGLGIENPVGGSKWLEKKLQPVGLLPKRQGNWQEGVGEIASTFINPMTAAAVVGPKLYAAEQRAIENAMAPTTLNKQAGAIVWHGSPHKFDKFDSSKIGTGEGAQAYGHGLYFAEAPDVAKQYQSTLTADRGFNFGGKSGLTREQIQDLVNAREGGKYLDGVTKPSGVADRVLDDVIYGGKGQLPRQYKPGSERAALYERLMQEIQHSDKGALYKVDLPDEHIAKMLDWDKPLSEQPKNVRDAYKKYLQSQQASEHAKSWTRYSEGMRLDQAEPLLKNPGGENLYKNAFPSRDAANQWATENGIPGIRYLDGGSRGTGAGTSNFVVFPGNEDILKILERNGQPVGGLLGR